MKKIILKIDGMSCSGCSSGLEKYLNKQEGIKSASVNLVLEEASIEYDDSILTIDDLDRFVSEAGFKSLGEAVDDTIDDDSNDKDKKYLIFYGALTVIVLYISMAPMIGFPSIPFLSMEYPVNYSVLLFILVIPFLVFGFDIFKSGFKNLIHRMPNMDTLVSLGVISSFLYSLYSMIMIFNGDMHYVHNLYFESCAVIIFFVKLGRYIDGKNKEKTKDAIKDLVQITPKTALIKDGDKEREVTIDEVKKGDILIVKPGMKVAVDGEVVEGESFFDEAFITGESVPSKKSKGSKVIAGSMNGSGVVLYKAERIGKNSTISEIVKLVREASNTKAPIARLADKVCGYFVPGIMMIAIFTLVFYLLLGVDMSTSITTFVSVLVVACPCALGLATPLAVVISEGKCAKGGILVKDSKTLENVGKVDIFVFDKTGTLTYGKLQVSKIFNYSNFSREELLKIVSSIEGKSTHPIANAFKGKGNLDVTSFKEEPGFGVEGIINGNKYYVGNGKLLKKLNINSGHGSDETDLSKNGNSIVYVSNDSEVLGLIGVRDIVRESSREVVSKLKKMDKEVIMLTGDNKKTASIIADDLGIDNVVSDVLPKEKDKVIRNYMEEGHKVAMVGDGINDAVSLTSADVGISFNSGTDIAANSSSVILMNDDLEKIPLLISISKKTIRIIKQNLFWAFFYNTCMIPIAMGIFSGFGIVMNPMIASVSMTFSSLCVVLNSLRLRR